MPKLRVYAGAVLIGALAGMRSMAAPAVLGQLSRRGALANVTGPLAFVTTSKFAPTVSVMAIGEVIADKLPFTPNRTAVGPLLGRALTGGISGAVICSAGRRSVPIGAVVGAASAVIAAYAAYEFRKRAVQKWRLPDVIVALAEDGLVAAVGAGLTSRLSLSEAL